MVDDLQKTKDGQSEEEGVEKEAQEEAKRLAAKLKMRPHLPSPHKNESITGIPGSP